MATNTEAVHINTLLRYLTNAPRPGTGIPTDDEALESARYLAGRARKALTAGLTPDMVTGLWPRRRRSPNTPNTPAEAVAPEQP